jgi:hypothetical protein
MERFARPPGKVALAVEACQDCPQQRASALLGVSPDADRKDDTWT